MKNDSFISRFRVLNAAAALVVMMTVEALAATTPLSDQPILVANVPANVMLALSVEFPTAITRAHQGTTFDTSGNTRYLGYFDPDKCYTYGSSGYFTPSGSATSKAAGYACSGQWSGNFMNWATMQGIDTFRWVLTGGNRAIDEPLAFADTSGSPLGRTVLQRAYASGQSSSNFPDRSLPQASISSYTGLGSAFAGGDLTIKNYNMGFQVRFSGTSSSSSSSSSTSSLIDLNVSVEVCRDDTTGHPLEANCIAYTQTIGDVSKTVYKPVGLMQRYKDKMYFGAFGYLQLGTANATDGVNGSGTVNRSKDGGVLRAPIQTIDNEISETGAFKLDPYGLKDASRSIVDSGSINYLNKFGTASKAYKHFDPVSEMYAEVIKYFKNLKPTASYLPPGSPDPVIYDGFPVFTTWEDPAKDAKWPDRGPLSCKRNYVIGIGDVNSNYDRNLSGGSSPVPADVDYDMAGLTAKGWTDRVGALEGMGALGAADAPGGTENSYLMAGIAYYAHSSDIRNNLPGVQTVNTYWMDVLENGYVHRNQYWLTAKYGGFIKPGGATPGPFVSGDAWNSAGRKFSGNDLPDNYYTASIPDDMKSGLESAFQSIAAGAGSMAGAALSASQLSATTGGATTYQGSYDAATWSGDVVASRVNRVTDDTPDLTSLWSAAAKIAAQGSGGRRIVTLSPTDKSKVAPTPAELVATPFLWGNLSATQKLDLSRTAEVPDGDSADGERVLNYLRGDRTYETTAASSKLYRQRGKLLGDIVDSKVVYLGKPAGSYSDSYNPGYSQFKTDYAGRKPLIFVGANDGMLHAFDASETSDAGKEVFALVPHSVFRGPDNNPEVSGIQALARKTYSHRYYMNATPEIRDVDIARTGGKLSSFSPSLASDWRTLLVAGQGKGGHSFVAMDVTSISSTVSESDIAGRVLWEFTHPDMGFSFGRPLIAKTARWGWVVVLTGGYNNVNGTKPGQGAIFVLNAKTGALLGSAPIYTGSGTALSPAGLAQIEGYTPSYQDYTLDYVYGGDLDGNLWRFDFTSADNDLPAVKKIAEFIEGGTRQPVTTAPKVEYSAEDLKRYVFVGTGRLLENVDLTNSKQQTMYAVRDGTKSRAYGSDSRQLALPSGISFPAGRGNMSKVTDLLSGAKLSDATPMGWYYDLTGRDTTSTTGVAATERIILNLQANDGVLTWAGTIMNSDPCSITGTARLYSVQYGTGQSVFYKIVDGLRSQTEWLNIDAGLADTTLLRVGSSIRVLGTDVKGASKIYGSTIAESGEPRVVNWRIIRE